MIIDAHVHLPVGDGMDSLQAQKRRLLDELRRNGADQCIVIADSELESVIGTNEECISLFSRKDPVRVVVGISPLIDYEAQLAKAGKWLVQGSVVGLKLFTGHEGFYLNDPRLERVYGLAMRHDVPVLFHSGWDNAQFGDAALTAEVARRYPALKLVCCHCWYPQIGRCREVIALPNVYFDISSVADDPAMWPEISQAVRELIDTAPGRVVFGSDYSGCSMGAHVRFVRLLGLPQEKEESVLAGNAMRLYRL